MNKPRSFLFHDTHKILWDIEVQTNHRIPIRRLELVIRTCYQVDFSVPADHSVKMKENKKQKQTYVWILLEN